MENQIIRLAKIKPGKRKEALSLVYSIFDELDPTGTNTKKYRELFSKMTDKEFESFMENLWKDDTMNFVLDIVDYERDIDMNKIEKAAKKLGIPLEEYVMMPSANMNKETPMMTKVKVIVMDIIYKRLQQTTQKKNSTSIHISDRSATTGQVVGDDKNGRSSDVENFGLVTIEAKNTMRELNGFRADGLQRKNKAYSDIVKNGVVSLEEVEASAGLGDRTVLNTVDVLYLGMGIKTDLIDDSLVLTRTVKDM